MPRCMWHTCIYTELEGIDSMSMIIDIVSRARPSHFMYEGLALIDRRWTIIIILILHLWVWLSVRPELKSFLSLHRWTWDVTWGSPLTQLAMVLAETKVNSFERTAGQNYIKIRLTCGGLVTAYERDSRVAVVHGCFSEGDDSILSAFSWEPLRTKLQDN